VRAADELLDYALVRTLQAQVADALTRERQQRAASGLAELDVDAQRQQSMSLTRTAVSTYLREQMHQGITLPDGDFDARLVAAIDAAIWGAGELQALLDDPDVENIDINGCDGVWITYADGRGTVAGRAVAQSDAELVDIVRTLGSHAGVNARPFAPTSPQLDLRLGGGSRLSAVMSASERPLVSIRLNRFPLMFLADIPKGVTSTTGTSIAASLLQLGTVDERLAQFLQAAVLARTNIIVAGATDAGKTTILRALINCIPSSERLITVERALELGVGRFTGLHPNVAELEEVLPGADGSGGVDIGQLVRRTRRMNPSRVIVGEVLGPEVVEMLNAMSQGNDGSLSTIHARSGADVFDRLAVYARQHEGLDFPVTHALIGGAIDFVVFVKKNPLLGGRRTVTEVLEVTGSAGGHVTRSQIFGPSPIDGRAERDQPVGIMRASDLAAAGYDDAAWAVHWQDQVGADLPYLSDGRTTRDSYSVDRYSTSTYLDPSYPNTFRHGRH
jgi:pilus assembly protein CpaF